MTRCSPGTPYAVLPKVHNPFNLLHQTLEPMLCRDRKGSGISCLPLIFNHPLILSIPNILYIIYHNEEHGGLNARGTALGFNLSQSRGCHFAPYEYSEDENAFSSWKSSASCSKHGNPTYCQSSPYGLPHPPSPP